MAETAGSVQFGLTFGPSDGALQPPAEETLEHGGRGGGRARWDVVKEKKVMEY